MWSNMDNRVRESNDINVVTPTAAVAHLFEIMPTVDTCLK